jgi:hypothetical protein
VGQHSNKLKSKIRHLLRDSILSNVIPQNQTKTADNPRLRLTHNRTYRNIHNIRLCANRLCAVSMCVHTKRGEQNDL